MKRKHKHSEKSGKKPPITIRVHRRQAMFGRCRHNPHVSLPCNESREGFCGVDGQRCEVKRIHPHGAKIKVKKVEKKIR